MLTWHWEMLDVVDPPLFDSSPDGERRLETILSVTGRIRFMHAVQMACEHGNNGPALSWPSVYAYMQRCHRTYLVSRELSMFDQWFLRLQVKQMDLLREGGVASHPHDDLHRQLIPPSAASSTPVRWTSSAAMRAAPGHKTLLPRRAAPTRTPPQNPNYCLGDHKTSQQPCGQANHPTLPQYGLRVKVAKNEWPSTRYEVVGVLIDTVVRRTVAVSAARCDKLRVRADNLLTKIDISAGASCRDFSLADPIQPLVRSYRRVPSLPGLWSKAMIPRLPSDT
eukprot:jgi/Tetstr1/458282/TSEL_044768.t1